MSDLGGLDSSCISDDGAQRLIEGNRGVNLGWPSGRPRGDLSSYDSENTQTRVNANGVITWLNQLGTLGPMRFGRSIHSTQRSCVLPVVWASVNGLHRGGLRWDELHLLAQSSCH